MVFDRIEKLRPGSRSGFSSGQVGGICRRRKLLPPGISATTDGCAPFLTAGETIGLALLAAKPFAECNRVLPIGT